MSKVINSTKKSYINNVSLNSRNKMRATWKIINKEKGKTPPDMQYPQIIYEDKIITNQKTIAELFNTYFLSTACKIYAANNKHTKSNRGNSINYLFNYYDTPFPKIKWQYASTYETEKIIMSLKTTNTTGYDEISNCPLKLSSPYIISPLTHICNADLNSGVFPDKLKYTIVKLKHKKKAIHRMFQTIDQYHFETPYPKDFEKLIYTRIDGHFTMNNILSKQQLGFRAQHSTNQAAFSLINSTLDAMDHNQIAGGIFCDQQKAFDCVNHEKLFEKLQFCGTGKFKMLIQSYFTNRFQKITCNNKSSDWGGSLRFNFWSSTILNLIYPQLPIKITTWYFMQMIPMLL